MACYDCLFVVLVIITVNTKAASPNDLHLRLSNTDDGSQQHEIYLFRHCDKRVYQDYKCNEQGVQRAERLVWYFKMRLGGKPPGAILVPDSGGACQNSYRPIQTVEDIAAQYNMNILHPYCSSDTWEVAHYVFQLRTKRPILIAYEHHNLTVLAYDFGVRPQPPPYPDDRFDLMFHIHTNVTGRLAQLTIETEGLAIPNTSDRPWLPPQYRALGPPDQLTEGIYVIPPYWKLTLILSFVFAVSFGAVLAMMVGLYCILSHSRQALHAVYTVLPDLSPRAV
jgi:hypothetical protein